MAPRKTATARGGKNRSHTPGRADKHTSNTGKDRTSYRGAVSTLNSISHSWIFFSFLVVSSPRSYLFTSGTGWVRVFTLHQGMEQILSDIRRSTFEIGAVQHRCVTEIARHNRSYVWTEALYPVWFSWWRKSYYPVKCEHIIWSMSVSWCQVWLKCCGTVTSVLFCIGLQCQSPNL